MTGSGPVLGWEGALVESNRVRAQQHGLCVRARAAERASCHQSRPARHLGRLDQCVHDKMADGVATKI